MNFLFVIENGRKSTLYIYSIKKDAKKLLRIPPYFMINNQSVADILLMEEKELFLQKIDRNIIAHDYYVFVKQANLLPFLFQDCEKIEISSKKAFITEKNDTTISFEKGKNLIDLTQLGYFFTFDKNTPKDSFERQEHVLRLFKNNFIGKKLSYLRKAFNDFSEIVETNLTWKDAVKILPIYLRFKNVKTKQLILEEKK